ncbi:uncharacterized protein yc1106_07843 [Curvularia clavata]|uniref:Uncharacterized protein n=1 Tax=Curvularia clavata TaxID=95742 RepID=A0A9Q8ZFN1_CURCL|nr:uncharacterized protein yc1106_07843 [Curvularia clavata]
MASTSSWSDVTTDHPLSRENQVKKRISRRRRRHNGPLQLQFLTATDPSHFKNEDTRRSVRSHAMAYHRNRPRKEGYDAPATRKGPTTSILVERISYEGRSHINAPDELGQHLEQQRHGNETALRTGWVVHEGATFERTPQTQRRLFAATCTLPTELTRQDADSKGSSYTRSQEEQILRFIMTTMPTLSHIGDGVDPFLVLPNFKSPEINSLGLKRHCIRVFASDSFYVKWLPMLLSHPHLLLSSSIIASVWLDTLSSKPVDSKQTYLLKDEIIGMINERLQHSNTQSSDATIMVVLHLFVGEVLASNEAAIRVHERGIAKLILHRGGIRCLGNELLAEACAVCCYHGSLIFENEPLPALAAYTLAEVPSIDCDIPIPESPLFCSRADFTTVSADLHCSTDTCNLLKGMRDLTDLSISHQAAFEILRDNHELDTAHIHKRDVEYNSRVAAIRKCLTRLPAAHIPGLPTSNDWVYEACRITALIYAASVILRLPFSTAANPCRNPLVAESEAFNCVGPEFSLLNTHLSEALFKALQRTNVGDMWNKMSGVFYWVSTVGAAAARLPPTLHELQQQSRDAIYAKWVQRCLVVYSSRTMIKLMFDHARPLLAAQEKLLKIQELVGRRDDIDGH